MSKKRDVKKDSGKIAIVLSIISIFFTVYYSNKEYKYKLSSKIAAKAAIKVDMTKNEKFDIDDVKIKILNRNNLDEAYLISPSNVVEKLNINVIENTIENNLNEDIKFKNYDINIDNILYKYRFILLKGKDGGYNLQLIYIKIYDDTVAFKGASGIEVWGFENSNKDDPEYEGERIMAKKYKEIINGLSTYIR